MSTLTGSMLTADVTTFLRRAALVAPARPAVVAPDGVIDYRTLADRVRLRAATLPPAVSGPEAIGVVADHDSVVPELYLAILVAGHAIVPISSRMPDETIAKIAAKSGMRIGFLAPSAMPRRLGLAATSGDTRWISDSGSRADARVLPSPQPLPAGTAIVPFTSGTTGEPKGVVLSHANLMMHALMSAFVLRITTRTCHVNPMPLSHFTGASRVIIALVEAGTHVILPAFDPPAVWKAVDEWGGTHMALVPTMVRDLLQADPERYNLSSLETLVYGTAPMPLAVARELTARIPCGLINGYGLTESCAMATALGADAHRQAIEKNDDATLGSVGWPVPGIEVAILDPRQQDLPTGSGGEIALRGAKLSSGYLRDGEQTESHFLPTGWLLTGDRGCLSEDGRLTLQGRMDDMIISGGLNIQPAEVEEKALQYGGVAACAAFGIPSERWGQELHLAVTPAAGETLDPDLITAFLRTRVDRYKVPKAVHIVDALPVTGIGKIQRARLRERAMRGEI